jgi:PEP-CTERM motif
MNQRVRSYKSIVAVAALVAGIAAGVTSASAVVILTDDFGVTGAKGNWGGDSVFVPIAGSVDLVGPGFFDNLVHTPASGNAVDLNGSTHAQGTLGSVQTGIAAGTYTLTFLLAGPAPDGSSDPRSGNTSTTTVSLGSWSAVLTPTTNEAYTPETFTFTTSGGRLDFASSNSTNANIGNLLDDVTLATVSATVPEPSTWAMMVLGFLGLGFAGYRKTKTRLPLGA